MTRSTAGSRTVSRIRIAVAGFVVAVSVGAVAMASEEFELPGFLSADEQRPVDTPKAGQQVSVLQVQLGVDGDKIAADIRSQEVLDSFAPKSVARSAGEWEVHVLGKKELTYRIRNPLLDVEVENPDDRENPYASVPADSLDWTLIVPLYDQDGPLGAASIEVVDLTTRQVILSTQVGDKGSD